MYQIPTLLLVAPLCGFILFLTRFYAARRAVWKLRKAHLVSHRAFQSAQDTSTELMRRENPIANAGIQAHRGPLLGPQGKHQGATAQLDLAHRDVPAREDVPHGYLLRRPLAILSNADGGDHPVRRGPSPII